MIEYERILEENNSRRSWKKSGNTRKKEYRFGEGESIRGGAGVRGAEPAKGFLLQIYILMLHDRGRKKKGFPHSYLIL